MYLTVDTVNSFDEIPTKNLNAFDKAYLIKGGCKDMKIFKNKNVLKHIEESLDTVSFPCEVYKNKELMKETKESEIIKMVFNDIKDKVKKSTSQDTQYYLADADLDKSFAEYEFKSEFSTDFDNKRQRQGLLFFYGKDTFSGCHIHTSEDYIINQISGTKIVYTFDYNDNDYEFVGAFDKRNNFIKNNIFHMDHSKMKIYKVILEEGDSLLMPPWWPHAVESIGTAVTMTKTYNRNDWWLLYRPYIFLIYIIGFFDDTNFNVPKFFMNIYYDYPYTIMLCMILVIIFLKRRHFYKYLKST